ncbi:flagellar export chaperone FliS [Roseibium aggregatum]|uniref:Flagellar protein FliS n=1 Tax=Roseibium aggregatum TaxID=187304 RepID=A0A939J5A7_9HYPH|nr:flagellar protein FliS [Roseibium aggregatum]MBN9672045.1 flagellar protein FliS [Roseibium aggregatum]
MSYAMNRAISAYRTAATTVAPPAAVTLLFDEVLNAIVLAARHLRDKDYEESHRRIARATGILRGLRQNVNPDIDQALGQQLITMYTRNIFALNTAVGKPDAANRFATLAEGLLELRNAWADMTTLAPRNAQTLMSDIHGERIVAEYF